MPAKRRSDPLTPIENTTAKRARANDAGDAVVKQTVKAPARPQYESWMDVPLEGEDEGDVRIYDDCNTIRRKIRALLKTPGFKVTHWLRDIGSINPASYSRFMSLKGPTGGADNGTYYAAYVYFEKVRIFEGKKKTPTRIAAERDGPFSRERARTHIWVLNR